MCGCKRVRDFLTGILALACISSPVYCYQLTLPDEYTAFSGDLEVMYKIPDGVLLSTAFIRVSLLTDRGDEEITTLGIDPKYQTGNKTVTCGVIEVAGKYAFQMYMYMDGPLLHRAVVIVRWPTIALHLPSTHFAQSDSVQLGINSTAVCNPRLKRYGFEIQLEYADNKSMISITGSHEVLYSRSFSNLSAKNVFIEFPCSLFDISGIYRASIVSSFSAISVVSRSNAMFTTNNPAYRINIWSDRIFPCHNVLMINYVLPQCPGSGDSTKIRIYMLRRKSSGSLAAPLEKHYVEEHPADPDKTFISPSCNRFDTVAIGYCFQIVTIARQGVIINQTDICLSAHPDSDGGWSVWSQWSACSVTCGMGKMSRYRMCDSPTPNFGGAFCQGDSMQNRDCAQFCPDSIPLTPLHTPNVDSACACGCRMSSNQGKIVASGRCTGTSKWLISVEKYHVIKLRFSYLSLYQDKQWVKVRNGGSPNSDLIAFSDGQSDIFHVTSTTNQMLVEFYTEPDGGNGNRNLAIYPLKPEQPVHVHGFIADFISTETEITVIPVSAQPVKESNEPSIWESTVTIVGIVLCGLVVFTAIAFVIYHRACHKRHHKYAMAAHEESPKRMCKSTSMSSPSHESHQGIEIEHDMEVPLTGVYNGVNKTRAKTPGSSRSKGSFSSTCSNKGKQLRTRADVEHGGSCRASPLSPNRDYTPVTQDASPRKKHRVHELNRENENNMSLFRTSPLTKPKVPRSPKVHPSPKVKKQKSVTPTSDLSDTQRTKLDILSKRFGNSDRDNKRVVMGSDYTPTNSVKSPPSDGSRADCETPTNIDQGVMYRNHARFQNSLQSDKDDRKDHPNDINLSDFNKSEKDTERKPASGTSDDSTSAEKESGSNMTTSFIENGTKPRRPTSLTESYSKMSIASALSRGSMEGLKNGTDSSKDKSSVTSSDDRQNALPKPDGQSPKSQRLETTKTGSKNSSPTKTPKASTPRSVRSVKSDSTDSNNTKSPARSINTPSDVMELEYDDFIDMDDTYSYFDPVVTEQLTFHGVERVKVTPKTPNAEV